MQMNPVIFGETMLTNRDGSPRRYWEHQIDDLRCDAKNIIHLDGRDVGKSICLTTDILFYSMMCGGHLGLVAAPFQGQLDSLIEELELQIDKNEVIYESITKNKFGHPSIKRKPYYQVEFTNGSILYFRPAGAYGDSFRGLHVDRIWVDEGAFITEPAWIALHGCLKAGGRLKIYSTPNGIRTSTYYRLTNSQAWKVFRWPSWINPHWTEERNTEKLDFYGGEDTAGYQHEVAGEHGKPAYGAFPIERIEKSTVDIPEYRCVRITGNELNDCIDEKSSYDRLELLLGMEPHDGRYWLGGDTGYTNDPTELLVLHEREVDGVSALFLVLRVHLVHVLYTHVAQAIGLIDSMYHPAKVSFDRGGNGTAIEHDLCTLDKYRDQFTGRVMGVDFGGRIELESPDGGKVSKPIKAHMTDEINRIMQHGRCRLPSSDTEIIEQFATQTYTMNNGVVVYSKGHDHVIDAMRCAVLGWSKSQDVPAIKAYTRLAMPVVTAPVFV